MLPLQAHFLDSGILNLLPPQGPPLLMAVAVQIRLLNVKLVFSVTYLGMHLLLAVITCLGR
mgnify:CR=1 FL=1